MSETTDLWMKDWIKEVLEKGEKQVKLELEDYWKMMQTYAKVLDRVTNGRMSKTGYTWETIERVLEEIEEEEHKQELVNK